MFNFYNIIKYKHKQQYVSSSTASINSKLYKLQNVKNKPKIVDNEIQEQTKNNQKSIIPFEFPEDNNKSSNVDSEIQEQTKNNQKSIIPFEFPEDNNQPSNVDGITDVFYTNGLFSGPEVSAWQGIRPLGGENYLIVGTTTPGPTTGQGIIYNGNISYTNGRTFNLSVPDASYSSIYGPDFDNSTGNCTFVGSYNKPNIANTFGFVYQGTLNQHNLDISSNYVYPEIFNNSYKTTFLHSTMNNYVVGNSQDFSGNTISFIYNIVDLSSNDAYTEIKYPLSQTTTTYGIWYNGENSYTIVGGYSLDKVDFLNIYKNGNPTPYGNAFIAEFNSLTNIVYNYTTIPFDEGTNIISHIQGISGFDEIKHKYTIAYNVLDLSEGSIKGYLGKITRNEQNIFSATQFNEIIYPENPFAITTANSVADNKIVGLILVERNSDYFPFQSSTLDYTAISSINYQKSVLENELIKFDKQFIQDNISYSNGIFTFETSAVYEINFSVYLQNMNYSITSLSVEYTINNVKDRFIVSCKGIDDVGTSTAHSMVLPCSFSNKFFTGDTISIKNISPGTINLMSNYSETSIGSIITISEY